MPDTTADDCRRHYAIVARAIGFIRANSRRQPALAEVAAAVHLSEYHLQRVFAAWAGISPKRFLQYLTKEYAKQALHDCDDLLSVSAAVGLSGGGRLHDLMVSCEAMTPGEIKAGGRGVEVGCGHATTPFGDALIGWTPRGICHLAFCSGDPAADIAQLAAQWPAANLIADDTEAARLAASIFHTGQRSGRLHLVLRGTNFQIKVWEALIGIEPSQRISYGRLAAMAGSPQAQRAAGSALAANNIAYLIPCHRVIRESGDIGNYRWGPGRKAAMLAWEAAQATAAQAAG
jgi:AraC family transcriptional regulator of adaptative response/methylated-DNA-[protein]-cysteine methyltransferase